MENNQSTSSDTSVSGGPNKFVLLTVILVVLVLLGVGSWFLVLNQNSNEVVPTPTPEVSEEMMEKQDNMMEEASESSKMMEATESSEMMATAEGSMKVMVSPAIPVTTAPLTQ